LNIFERNSQHAHGINLIENHSKPQRQEAFDGEFCVLIKLHERWNFNDKENKKKVE
jgi:hypothetical protein